MNKKNDGILKRSAGIILNMPHYGLFGGGTSKPKYYNQKGEEIPEEKTKWFKLKKKEVKK